MTAESLVELQKQVDNIVPETGVKIVTPRCKSGVKDWIILAGFLYKKSEIAI